MCPSTTWAFWPMRWVWRSRTWWIRIFSAVLKTAEGVTKLGRLHDQQEISQRRERLNAAFRKIDFPPEKDVHLCGAIDALCQVDTSVTGIASERGRVNSTACVRPV